MASGIMANNVNVGVVVGQRQVLRQLKQHNISKVLLASDADSRYKQTMLKEIQICNVEVDDSFTAQQLADKFGVDVPSAVVGILIRPID